MAEKNRGRRRRLAVALAAVLTCVVVAAVIVQPARQAPEQAAEIEGPLVPLTEQEIAEVKAAVEKQTGMPVRYVWRNRQGAVEAFPAQQHRGRLSYRLQKTEAGWKVVGTFMAFAA